MSGVIFMNKKMLISIPVIFLITFSLIDVSFATDLNGGITCETCPMTVGNDALNHLMVTDGNGTRHYVECIGCAFKLLKTYDTIKIVTFCDWYGPNYTITADISEHGAKAAVNPSTALILIGGGCTGNRVAYNQTAADQLIANGFSNYTMMMMHQALPSNTNTTTLVAKANTFAVGTTESPAFSPTTPIVLAVAGIAVIVVAFVAFKKLKK
jgi:hypothetical protein